MSQGRKDGEGKGSGGMVVLVGVEVSVSSVMVEQGAVGEMSCLV